MILLDHRQPEVKLALNCTEPASLAMLKELPWIDLLPSKPL